jgi:hypothetical protein
MLREQPKKALPLNEFQTICTWRVELPPCQCNCGVLYVDLHLEKCVKISGYVIHGAEVKIPSSWPLNTPSCFKGKKE